MLAYEVVVWLCCLLAAQPSEVVALRVGAPLCPLHLNALNPPHTLPCLTPPYPTHLPYRLRFFSGCYYAPRMLPPRREMASATTMKGSDNDNGSLVGTPTAKQQENANGDANV